jgi:FkbM family methyltransferase
MSMASAQWPRWIVRRLLSPIYPVPVILTSRTGVRCALGDDPVDDAIFRHVHRPGNGLYFPPLAGGEPDGIILDVGAHHGIYAMEALRRYPHCRLVAIEPDPDGCRRIAANAGLNGFTSRIEIVQAGLADVDGRGWLALDEHGSWASRTLADDPEATLIPLPGPSPTQVELKTLHTILSGRQPAIVKCNAEGAEFALIPQLLALGHRPRVIVLMIHPDAGSPDELVSLLSGAGYRVCDADTPPRGCRLHCFWKPEEHR